MQRDAQPLSLESVHDLITEIFIAFVRIPQLQLYLDTTVIQIWIGPFGLTCQRVFLSPYLSLPYIAPLSYSNFQHSLHNMVRSVVHAACHSESDSSFRIRRPTFISILMTGILLRRL